MGRRRVKGSRTYQKHAEAEEVYLVLILLHPRWFSSAERLPSTHAVVPRGEDPRHRGFDRARVGWKYRTGNAWEGKGNSMKIAWTGSLRLKESTFMSSLLLQNAAFVACFQRVWFDKHDNFALSRTGGQHQGYSRKNCVLDPHIMQLNTIRYSRGIRRVIKASFINFLLCYSLLCVLWGKRQVAKRLASNTMSFESSLRIAKELLRYRILEYLSCF